MTVIDVLDLMRTVPSVVPKYTFVTASRFVPVRTTNVLPEAGPWLGAIV